MYVCMYVCMYLFMWYVKTDRKIGAYLCIYSTPL